MWQKFIITQDSIEVVSKCHDIDISETINIENQNHTYGEFSYDCKRLYEGLINVPKYANFQFIKDEPLLVTNHIDSHLFGVMIKNE